MVPPKFFNPVIPTLNYGQPRGHEGYFWHATFRAYFQSRISPQFYFRIPNPELQIREIQDPVKPIRDPPKTQNELLKVIYVHGDWSDRQTGRQTDRQTDRPADRQAGRQTDRTDRQTDRQANSILCKIQL